MRTVALRPLSKKRSRINGDRDREFAAFAIGSDEDSDLDARPAEVRPTDCAPAETLPAEAETHGDIPVEDEDLFGDVVDEKKTRGRYDNCS